MPVKYKDLVSKISEYQDIFFHLQKAINDEFLAFLQYSAGNGVVESDSVKMEFDEHAKEEYKHALLLFTVLNELGGKYIIEFPSSLMYNNDCGFTSPIGNVVSIIEDNIKGEQCAVTSYSLLLQRFEFKPRHKRIIQSIIDDEKKHISDLLKLKKNYIEEHPDKF